ncbi:class I SAM-dependent methyltransferase [Aquabacterium humicola]|uniref:class I SAM-dependent methyltransferase n=1 Tax=Aquabacterium humicola TaxID=3237377 RepID=UPI002543BBE3|nr:class I SAM-dependent methyltransferase [Rubrivivax pictus]
MSLHGQAAAVVNSQPYWEQRFEGDWEAVHGREQSRFFGELALAMWPAWLAERMRGDAMNVCDWGCALGDGSAALAEGFGVAVTGIDFSPAAVAKAACRYPQCRFLAEDWLAGSPDPEGGANPAYDLVFSSNTLEHFDAPWSVFERLAAHARRYVVLLLPFEEPLDGMLHEHRVRFDRSTVPLCPHPDWVLCDAALSDLGSSPFWPGQQVLLVYGRCSELAATGFSDLHSRRSRIADADAAQRQRERDDELAEICRQRDLASRKLAEIAQQNVALAQQNAVLAQQNTVLTQSQQQLLQSRSWRWTAPLRRLQARLRPGPR